MHLIIYFERKLRYNKGYFQDGFTAEQVANICARGDSESEIDSETGGISSGEEFDLNQELEGNSASLEELR